MENERLYTTKEAAERLRLSPHTLAIWRSQANRTDEKHRDNPVPFVKIGSAVRYQPSVIEAILSAGE